MFVKQGGRVMDELFKKICQLSYIDQILLVILCVSLLLKLINGIFLYAVAWFFEHKKGQGICKFLIDNQKSEKCSNLIYASKYFIQQRNICARKDCPGYRSKSVHVNDILQSHWLLSLLTVLVNWGIQLPSVLLIIRTLLEVNSK